MWKPTATVELTNSFQRFPQKILRLIFYLVCIHWVVPGREDRYVQTPPSGISPRTDILMVLGTCTKRFSFHSLPILLSFSPSLHFGVSSCRLPFVNRLLRIYYWMIVPGIFNVFVWSKWRWTHCSLGGE